MKHANVWKNFSKNVEWIRNMQTDIHIRSAVVSARELQLQGRWQSDLRY